MQVGKLRRTTAGILVMADVAASHGLPLRGLLAGTGLRKADLDSPAATVSFEQEFRMIRNLQQHCGDASGIGLEVGVRYHFTTLASVGFALVSSRDLRGVFEIILRYADLNTSMVQITTDESADGMRIGFQDSVLPKDIRRFVVERSVGATIAISRELLGRRVVPLRVAFGFPAPTKPAFYRTLIRRAPVFDAAPSSVLIADVDVRESIRSANTAALHMAEMQCHQLLWQWRPRSGFSAQVRECIAAEPGDMGAVAARLHLSVRTLRRRLSDEGTGYAALYDEVRQALAEDLLAMPRLPLSKIADRLGYAEPSSFIHAFKRWTGLTPSAFRVLRKVRKPSGMMGHQDVL